MHAVTDVPSTIVIVGVFGLAKGGAGDFVSHMDTIHGMEGLAYPLARNWVQFSKWHSDAAETKILSYCTDSTTHSHRNL